MQKKFGLDQATIRRINEVFSKHNRIEKIILYGSRAIGNFKKGSDIDITLVAPSMNLTELMQLEVEIDDLMIPYKVDLSLCHTIDNQELLEHIQRFGQLFE